MCRAHSLLLQRRAFAAAARSLPFPSNTNRGNPHVAILPPLRFLYTSSLSGDAQQGVNTTGDSFEFKKWHNGGGWIHNSAKIEPTVVVEIGAVVHSGCVLGANVHLGSGAIIGPFVEIGQATKIGYNASLSNCSIGDHCIIHNGVSVGQDGFGFHEFEGRMLKKPQLLHARIGNHVEVGANTCIDRGSWRDTTIGDHSKIDNLVQIGHNVVMGRCCMLCGQVGVAGSVTIGDYVTLGGRVAVRDHVSIVSKVRLAANSCVTKDIHEPGDYGGFPAVPISEWRKQIVRVRWLSKTHQS